MEDFQNNNEAEKGLDWQQFDEQHFDEPYIINNISNAYSNQPDNGTRVQEAFRYALFFLS